MAKTKEKIFTGYRVASSDKFTVNIDGAGAVEIFLTEHANVAVDDFIPTIEVLAKIIIKEISDQLTETVTSSYTTDGRLVLTCSSGNWTSFVVAGSGLISYLGGTSIGSGITATGGTIITFDSKSDGLFWPDDCIIKDDSPIVDIKSVGTESDSGAVTVAYLGQQVNKRAVTLFAEHDETWQLSSTNYNNIEYQYKKWAQGYPLTIHKNRDDNTAYNITTPNLDGYRVYRMNPAESFSFQPTREVPGMDLFWNTNLNLIECASTEYITDAEAVA